MKQYRITIDVTMSGDLYLDAEDLAQAEEKARKINFTPQDLRNFHFLTSEIYDCEEIEDFYFIITYPDGHTRTMYGTEEQAKDYCLQRGATYKRKD